MLREIRHPIETIRTAPVQLGVIALDTTVMITDQVPHSIEGWAVSSFLAAAIAGNGTLAISKIKLRNRMEGCLSRRGFDDRAMKLTTKTYCGRQATKVACENFGYAEEYAALCQEKLDDPMFTWLPHI